MTLRKAWISLTLATVVGSVSAPRLAAAQEGEGAPGPVADAPADPGADPGASLVNKANKRRWGIGARLRYVFVPAGVIELFVDHATSMSSVGFGFEVVTRKGDFDIVFGFEYDGVSPEDGLYLEKGDDPTSTTDGPDLTEFDGLAALGFDVSFLWHAKLAEKIHLRYGAGIGVAVVLGDVLQTDYVCPPGTRIDDLDDPAQCSESTAAGHKVRTPSDDVPPVVPIIGVLLGARFTLAEGLTLNVETGFRDMFFLGVGTDYVF